MYKLHLTLPERRALWWNQEYHAFFDIFQVIEEYEVEHEDGSATYDLPEYVAYQIRDELAEDTSDFEESISCLSKDFSDKLILWCFELV